MTTITTAPVFSHGEFPVAAELNKIVDGQKEIYAVARTYARNSFAPEMDTGERATFTHAKKWLHYKSTGTIIDPARDANPAAGNDPVSLPNPSNNWVNTFDLDSVAWIAYGSIYYVEGTDFAQEFDS